MARVMRVTVDGTAHEADMERLTFAEGRAIEKVSGLPLSDILGAGKKPTMTTVQAMVWVVLKRDDTTLKFSDLDDRAIGDFQIENVAPEAGEDANPTEPSVAA